MTRPDLLDWSGFHHDAGPQNAPALLASISFDVTHVAHSGEVIGVADNGKESLEKQPCHERVKIRLCRYAVSKHVGLP
jgi:hypothetical protein